MRAGRVPGRSKKPPWIFLWSFAREGHTLLSEAGGGSCLEINLGGFFSGGS